MGWPSTLLFEILGPFPLSFETGEQTNTRFYTNHRLRVRKVRSIVTKALADTDAGTITISSALGSIGVITHPLSDAINTERELDAPAATNLVLPGGWIRLITAKSTAGGKVLVTVEAEREIA